MKILQVYRVFGTMGEKDLVVPNIEVAAHSLDEALRIARACDWKLPVTGLTHAGEIVVP